MSIRQTNFKYFGILVILLALYSCETEFIPEGTDLQPEVVVEGYIEAGEGANPPFILLTKSVSFFNEFDPNEIENLFVHDALINVNDGAQDWPFTEVCLNDIPDAVKPLVLEALGLNPDSTFVNLCVYIDISFQLEGEVGKKYELTIDLPDRQLTATTSIPPHVPLKDLYFKKPSEEAPDSLLEMWGAIIDPSNQSDHYRYFSAENSDPFMASFQSVIDDPLFDGQEFEFILPKAESLLDPPDFEQFGLYHVGDTARIKWTNIDAEHFNFWSTLEFNAASQGPFSSYTQVVTNINGGLGVWGGYSTSIYEIIVEE